MKSLTKKAEAVFLLLILYVHICFRQNITRARKYCENDQTFWRKLATFLENAGVKFKFDLQFCMMFSASVKIPIQALNSELNSNDSQP